MGHLFYTHSVLSFCFFSFFFWLLSIAFLLLFSTSFSLHYASILRNLAPFELISKYFASSSSLNDTFKRPFLRPAATSVWSNFFFFGPIYEKVIKFCFANLGDISLVPSVALNRTNSNEDPSVSVEWWAIKTSISNPARRNKREREREREKESNSHQEAATAAETGEEAQNGRVDGWVFLRRGYGLTLTISSRIVDTCGPVATRYLQRAFAH